MLREIHEEVGVPVRDVTYLGSQAWPFPRSLMVGFQALADVGAPLRPAEGEIAEAMWVTRAELRMPWRRATGRARRARDCCCRAPSRSPGRCWRRGPRSADRGRARTPSTAARPTGLAHRNRTAHTKDAGSTPSSRAMCRPGVLCASLRGRARGAARLSTSPGSGPVVHRRRAVGLSETGRGSGTLDCVKPVLHRAAALRAAGYGEDDIRRLLRSGVLTPVRRGGLRGELGPTTVTRVTRCSCRPRWPSSALAPWPATCPRPWCTAFRPGDCHSSGPT